MILFCHKIYVVCPKKYSLCKDSQASEPRIFVFRRLWIYSLLWEPIPLQPVSWDRSSITCDSNTWISLVIILTLRSLWLNSLKMDAYLCLKTVSLAWVHIYKIFQADRHGFSFLQFSSFNFSATNCKLVGTVLTWCCTTSCCRSSFHLQVYSCIQNILLTNSSFGSTDAFRHWPVTNEQRIFLNGHYSYNGHYITILAEMMDNSQNYHC